MMKSKSVTDTNIIHQEDNRVTQSNNINGPGLMDVGIPVIVKAGMPPSLIGRADPYKMNELVLPAVLGGGVVAALLAEWLFDD